MNVRTVYGDTLTVSREHYDRGKTMLPIFTKTGKRRDEHYERMGWKYRGDCYLHRANIKEILP